MTAPTVSLHQLRVFAAVIEQGTLTHAAHTVYLSQPAVSAQIRQLETFVGARVLARRGRRVVPTAAGAALYRYAREVLAATDVLLQQVDRIRSGELDHVTVGGNPTSSVYVLPALLARFQREHPGTQVSLVSAQSPELIGLLRRDAVDIAVLSGDRAPAEFPAELLGVDEMVVVESTQHPLLSGNELGLEELSGAPFVRPLIGHDRLAIALDRLLAERHLGPRRFVMDLTTWEGVIEAVRAGAGLALVPRGIAQRGVSREELRVVPIREYRETRPVFLVLAPRWQAEQASHAFATLLERLKSELPAALDLQPAGPHPSGLDPELITGG